MLFCSVFSRFAACLPHFRRKRHAALFSGSARLTGEGCAAGCGCADSRRHFPVEERRRPFRSTGGFRARFRADSLDMLEDGSGSEGSDSGDCRLTDECGEVPPGIFSWEGPGVLVLSFVFGCLLGIGLLGMMLLFNLGGF